MIEPTNSALMQKTLDALWLRQRVIANNIANIDTPGYKSKQVKFEEYLNDGTNQKDIPDAKVVADDSTVIKEDGNNVDIDKESVELYRVQIQYEYMVRKLTDQYNNLKTVLTEGRK